MENQRGINQNQRNEHAIYTRLIKSGSLGLEYRVLAHSIRGLFLLHPSTPSVHHAEGA